MKKSIVFLLCAFSLLLGGCDALHLTFDSIWKGVNSFIIPDYEEEAKENAEQALELLLDALQDDDRTAAAEVFSENMRRSLADFPQMLDELFAYFVGEVQGDLRPDFSGVKRGVDYGEYTTSTTLYCDIITTAGSYRMTFSITCLDTDTPENEGIWSLSIIRAADDPRPEVAYEGDCTYADGIHVGAVCAPVTAGNDALARELSLQTMRDLLAALRQGDTEAAADLFAPNARAQAKDLSQTLEALRRLLGNAAVELTQEGSIAVDYGLHANHQWQEHGVFSYRAETPHGAYLLALKQTYYDTTIAEDVGLWSLYVFPLPDAAEAPVLPATEADYAPGIHIIEGGR